MTAVVKTQIQTAHEGKNGHYTNIPFLERNDPEAFSTISQQDFLPVSSKRAEPFHPHPPAQVIHKDLRHFKEYLTEARVYYHHHPLQQITRTPHWFKLYTSIKMQTDPGEVAFLTTQSQKFQPQPFQPPPTPIPHKEATKKIQHVEKTPESTNQASFTPHYRCPVVKATVKHLEEGFPTIKGDRRRHSFVSQYNNSFQGAWSRAAKSTKKHSLRVMGDPVKIVERESTHDASYSWPTDCRPPVLKERLKLNLSSCKDIWSSVSREAFCHHKMEDPVVVTRRNQKSSSLPKGDTDTRRNKERMSATTNGISFSHPNPTERPTYVSSADLMTRSHVQFSPPSPPSMYYKTAAKEHYSKQDGERARPTVGLPSNILCGPEHMPKTSTSKTDYVPYGLTACREMVCPQTGNIRFPLADQHFNTTHREHYSAKPFI